jgi:class 3 adenylate cyclase/predicted ATPase
LELNSKSCPVCRAVIPTYFRFCGQCGFNLEKQETNYFKADIAFQDHLDFSQIHGQSDAERRQVTVIFVDLIGSSRLSEMLDVEEYKDIIDAYRKLCSDVVEQYAGYIAKYLGDGILIYFGYPIAQDRDAERAVAAGLNIIEAIKNYNNKINENVDLAVRIGIHSGLVVAGDMGQGSNLQETKAVIGEVPNIAARLQTLAPYNSLVIGASTFKLVKEFFNCRSMGIQLLKGFDQSLEVFEVTESLSFKEHDVRGAFLPFTGRSQDLSELSTLFENVKKGAIETVFIRGEAGIGKSRLIQAFKDSLQNEEKIWFWGYCSLHTQNSAFYALVDIWRRYLKIDNHLTLAEKIKIVERSAQNLDLKPEEIVPYFSYFFANSEQILKYYHKDNQGSEDKKEHLWKAFRYWFKASSEKSPVVFILEDIHWADPSTIATLKNVFYDLEIGRILIIFCARPEFSLDWSRGQKIHQIQLGRLKTSDIENLITSLTKGKKLPQEVLQYILDKTDGIPLFAEELTKAILEAEVLEETSEAYLLKGTLSNITIPVTLQDSLMARLDRLGPAKAVAQLAATFGRHFSFELLQSIFSIQEPTLRKYLQDLIDAGLIVETEKDDKKAFYFFKHNLIQEVAYASLLKSKRQLYHKRIAELIEERFPELIEASPELVAYHYTAAGYDDRAIHYWLNAGKIASAGASHAEAIAHLTKGLDLIQKLPPNEMRDQRELALRAALCLPLMVIKGWGANELEQELLKAYELCHKVGDTVHLIPVLRGLQAFFIIRGPLNTACDYAEKMVRLGLQLRDQSLLVESYRALAQTKFFQGELISAQYHFKKVQELTFPDIKNAKMSIYGVGIDPLITGLGVLSWIEWALGHSTKARQTYSQAIQHAKETKQFFTLSYVMNIGLSVFAGLSEPEEVLEKAEEAYVFAKEKHYPYWMAWSKFMLGWAQVKTGRYEDRLHLGVTGLELLKQGDFEYRGIGSEQARPYIFALLGDACLTLGLYEDGLIYVNEGIDIARKLSPFHFYDSSLYRIRADLTAERKWPGDDEAADADFRKTMQFSQNMQAKNLELRAALRYCLFLEKRERSQEIKDILKPICEWFTEPEDTHDFKEAQRLIEKY